MEYTKTFEEYLNESEKLMLIVGDDYDTNYAVENSKGELKFKGSRSEMIDWADKKKIKNIERTLKLVDKDGSFSFVINEAIKIGDRIKLNYPKYDNGEWSKSLNGKTGYVHSPGDERGMWNIKLDKPVKVMGDTISVDQWDKSYLKVIKENLNESDLKGLTLKQAKKKAAEIAKDEGVNQHVNKQGNSYEVSDWFDSDSTVASYG